MNDLTAAVLDGWDARSFSGGLAELRSLEASSFTGIVRADEDTAESGTSLDGPTGLNAPIDPTGHEDAVDTVRVAGTDPDGTDSDDAAGNDTADDDEPVPENGDGIERGDAGGQTSERRPWLAIIEGKIRGVFDGGIDDFSGATGTVYTAPAGALVLLCGMLERSGEERGDLHTEAHLSAVETDLPDDFSGYVELIGNGLDGAYYVVYDEGQFSPVVVREERGEQVASTGPDEFDRASERSSVYEVRATSLDTVAVPEPAFEPDLDPEPDSTDEPDLDGYSGSTDDREATPTDTDAGTTSGTGRIADDADGGLVAELRAERDRLRADVERLESALDAYRSGTSRGVSVDADGGIDTDDQPSYSSLDHRSDRSVRDPDGYTVTGDAGPDVEYGPDEALSGTTLLVRYDSQGAPTLARAGEDIDREAVRANLRITPHTDFDAPGAVVSGTDFDDFLQSSIEYQFVEWVLGDLFFEIRDTGNETALSALYEVIPAIDRADLRGTIDVEYVSEGDTTRGVEAFDVVFRDRMSDPLLVARLDETRAPAPVECVTDLLTAANRVGETVADLAGAICVSGGYFEPEALRTAEEVTDGGFLSRDSKKSFVKRSRRRGYHLCLVEVVGEGFHTSVPEL